MESYYSAAAVYVIVGILSVVIVMLVIMLLRLHQLFKKLFEAFGKGEKITYKKLVSRILFSRSLYVSSPTSEEVEMIYNYIKEIFTDYRVFMHITNDKDIADKILTEGFKYSENFYKSSEEISNSVVDISYKLQLYKNYGKFVVIMCIPRKMLHEIKERDLKWTKDFFVENGICEYIPHEELNYKLPSKFVRGYVDISNKKIVNSDLFAAE